jgi:glutamyl-tRNA reductase
VEVRERFAVPDSELPKTISELGALPGIAESVIVSTCNRVEFYAATENPQAAACAIRQFLEQRCGSVFSGEADPFFTFGGAASINHLFRVVSGLESMIIGETEILGQVKKAYASASENGGTARHLNKLFQRAFNVAKEVRTKTSITRGPVSVGSVTVDLAERIFGELHLCKVMILGAGETSELTARALLSRGVRSIIVSNRSHERAVALAAEMGGEAIRFDDWDKHFKDVDILISSTAAPHAIVTQAKLAPVIAQRPERPLFVIDLAVPRDVEPSVNEIEGVYLYDIDSLHAIARQGMETRLREVAVCEQLIARHVTEFSQWLGQPAGFTGVHPSPALQKP